MTGDDKRFKIKTFREDITDAAFKILYVGLFPVTVFFGIVALLQVDMFLRIVCANAVIGNVLFIVCEYKEIMGATSNEKSV